MLEENNETQKRKLHEFLADINLTINPVELLEFIYNSPRSICLNSFPFHISDSEKYSQVEILYQKYLDGDISKTGFLNEENKYLNFVKLLWLYDKVYVGVYINELDFKHSYYVKRNKTLFKKNAKWISKIIHDHKMIYELDTLEKTNSVIYLATRDIAPIVLFFEKYQSMLYLGGCSGLLYTENESFFDLLQTISLRNGLYLFKNPGKTETTQ